MLASLLLIAACGEAEEPEGNRTLNNAIAAAAAGDDMRERPVAPAAGALAEPPAPAPQAFQWTGRFAATPALCEGGVWDIRETGIVTDGETACDIDNVARAAGQVTLRLACTAEGTGTDETWTLRQRGEGMRVSRDNGRERIDVDLIRCG